MVPCIYICDTCTLYYIIVLLYICFPGGSFLGFLLKSEIMHKDEVEVTMALLFHENVPIIFSHLYLHFFTFSCIFKHRYYSNEPRKDRRSAAHIPEVFWDPWRKPKGPSFPQGSVTSCLYSLGNSVMSGTLWGSGQNLSALFLPLVLIWSQWLLPVISLLRNTDNLGTGILTQW